MSRLLMVIFMGIICSAVNIACIKSNSDEGQQSAQCVLFIIKCIIGSPDQTNVDSESNEGIFVSIAIELTGSRYDGKGAG